MSLWSINLQRAGAIVASGFLITFASVFTVLCLFQLGASPPLMSGAQAAFAIASILQVLLVALASTIIFASWTQSSRLIRLSVYATVAHLAVNVVVLALLLTAVASTMPCPTGRLRCPQLVAAKPVWVALSAVILIVQPGLSLIVIGYSFRLQDQPRRLYTPQISSRSPSTPTPHKSDQKRLLSTSGPWPNLELGLVESVTTIRSLKALESETGYGGGMRTYEEAERHEKARLRREMEVEGEGKGTASFPVASTSEAGILTPLGLQWREGDLPPYAS